MGKEGVGYCVMRKIGSWRLCRTVSVCSPRVFLMDVLEAEECERLEGFGQQLDYIRLQAGGVWFAVGQCHHTQPVYRLVQIQLGLKTHSINEYGKNCQKISIIFDNYQR